MTYPASADAYHFLHAIDVAMGHAALMRRHVKDSDMIEFMPESNANVVGVHASGTLTDTDYKTKLIPKFDALFKQYGKLKVLFFMDETFAGWNLNAAWDDASIGLQHRADFDKIAVVGGPAWVEWCVKLGGFLLKGDVQTFRRDQLKDAWRWIGA